MPGLFVTAEDPDLIHLYCNASSGEESKNEEEAHDEEPYERRYNRIATLSADMQQQILDARYGKDATSFDEPIRTNEKVAAIVGLDH